MKICIVDDDRTTVERIRCSIPWDKYGINETFAAYDAQNAKQLLYGHQIDLMLCDIQMPGLSGLELMEWIRAEQLDVQVIFLTNYAEFAYAQKAMRLGSFDYICKGTDLAEVEKAIARCVQEISKIRDRQRLQNMGEYYVTNADIVEARFYRELLTGIKKEDALNKEGAELPHPVTAGTCFQVVSAVFSLYAPPFADMDYEQAEQTVCEMIGSHFFSRTENAKVVALRDSQRVRFFILLSEEDDRSGLMNKGAFLLQNCSEEFHTLPTVYICPGEYRAADLSRIQKDLAGYDRSNVTRRDTVLRYTALQETEETLVNTGNQDTEFVRRIRELLLQGAKPQEIQKAVRLGLQEMMRIHPDRNTLERFRQIIRQIIHSSFAELDMFPDSTVFQTGQAMEMRAADSVPDMIQWTDIVIAELAQRISCVRQEQDPAEAIRRYIEAHYQEKIDRESIAGAMHISAGYAARLYKEKYGISMNDYILQIRLDKAKALLRSTTDTIGEIAVKCGFDSAAYFTACFRKSSGMTPRQFREKS